ncbi:MAG: Gfo/Idh/MocA family oxidoreductase [Candidatus Accumulibacter sp.]|jgi:predicted dehydrogenase|nr:Gfo/Idh/MocA family oxidoreductase [Accumulibacter sp.]
MKGVAILGAGAIAAVHADAFLRFSDRCEIRAVGALHLDRAKRLIDRKGLTAATACEGVDEALARDDVDVVSVCAPPGAHADIVVKALRAGKHVLVEKPMAPGLAECDRMIEAAQASRKLLSPIAQNRYKTPYHKMARLLKAGLGGPVKHVTVNSLWWRGPNYYDPWWRGTWDGEGGGCVMNHAVHHLDLLLWMAGMPRRVTALIGNVAHDNSECEDVGIAILEYEGFLAQVTASLVTHDEEQEIIFQTERGRLSVPWKTASSRALPNGFPEEDREAAEYLAGAYERLPPLDLEGHPAQIGNFLDAVDGRDELLITAQDGRNVIELITAIYEAAQSRSPVALPIPRDDAFYRRDSMLAAMPRFHRKTRSVERSEVLEIKLGRDVGR